MAKVDRLTQTVILNNDDREQWINNDPGLHGWFRSSRQSMRAFIKENKAMIDQTIKTYILQKAKG